MNVQVVLQQLGTGDAYCITIMYRQDTSHIAHFGEQPERFAHIAHQKTGNERITHFLNKKNVYKTYKTVTHLI